MITNYKLKERFYKIVLYFVMALSFISVVGNLILKFPLEVNIKWIVLFIFTFAVYKIDNRIKNLRFYYFIFIILIYMPFAFIDSGGSQNNFIAYNFFALITISYLFQGKKRNFFIFLLIGIFMSLLTIEYYFPQIIPVHNRTSQFFDRLFQVPLLLFSSSLITKKFADAYSEINKKLYSYAHYDELTATYNRRVFNDTIKNYFWEQKSKYRLVFIDLDNFKQVNDSRGHLVGDEILCFSAKLLKESFNASNDFLSRWGGDEFAVLSKDSENEIAAKVEAIKLKLEEETREFGFLVSMSYGMVDLGEFEQIDDAFRYADERLYKNKKHNKNRK